MPIDVERADAAARRRGRADDLRHPRRWHQPASPRLTVTPASAVGVVGVAELPRDRRGGRRGAERGRVPQPLLPRAPQDKPVHQARGHGIPRAGRVPPHVGRRHRLPAAVAGDGPQPVGSERDHDRLRAGGHQLPRGAGPPRPCRPARRGRAAAGQRFQLGEVRLDDGRAGGRARGAAPRRARPARLAPRPPPPWRPAPRRYPAAGPRGRLPDRTTALHPASAFSYLTQNSAYSSCPTGGPGSLNSAVPPRTVSTTAKVRRVSPPIRVKDAGTPSSPSADTTCSPVMPPASPVTWTWAPIARKVRATFSPLPPARARVTAGRLTPAQSTPGT